MTVILAPVATDELQGIWDWNAEQYGVAHADEYLGLLWQAIDRLAESHALGTVVPGRADLRYVLVRRRSRGHGHVLVYGVGAAMVTVAHVFHTAQDWQNTLVSESP